MALLVAQAATPAVAVGWTRTACATQRLVSRREQDITTNRGAGARQIKRMACFRGEQDNECAQAAPQTSCPFLDRFGSSLVHAWQHGPRGVTALELRLGPEVPHHLPGAGQEEFAAHRHRVRYRIWYMRRTNAKRTGQRQRQFQLPAPPADRTCTWIMRWYSWYSERNATRDRTVTPPATAETLRLRFHPRSGSSAHAPYL